MVLSPAEKQKRYRERLRASLKAAPDLSSSYMRRPISDLYEGSFAFEETLDTLGYKNLAPFDLPVQTYASDSAASLSGATALERLTGLAGAFLDAAVELHAFINSYKLDEIAARIREVEAADLSLETTKLAALAEIVRLNQIRTHLDREFRRSFCEINAKETPST